jgi:hypothetical protein
LIFSPQVPFSQGFLSRKLKPSVGLRHRPKGPLRCKSRQIAAKTGELDDTTEGTLGRR